jgi:YVTN family beta-propeller protein
MTEDREPALRAEPRSTNGRGPFRPTERARRLQRRLAWAGAALVLAGFVSAATGFPFRDRESASTVPLNSVAAIDPSSGKVVAKTAVGIDPQAVATGSGSVWIANTTDRTVSRLEPASASVQSTIPVGVYPSDIVVAPASVYVASGPTGQLVEIDPETNEAPRPQSAGAACGGVRESIALGAASLWLACDLTPSAVRMPLAARRVIPLTPASATLESHYSAIAFGAAIAWIADRSQNGVIAIDASTNRPVPAEIGVGREPWAIAVGFGSIWVANRGDGTVSRIEGGGPGEPARVRTIRVAERPVDIATGEGAVWVANAGGKSVSRIDPATSRVTRTIDLHNPPAGIAVGNGRVWVTVADE